MNMAHKLVYPKCVADCSATTSRFSLKIKQTISFLHSNRALARVSPYTAIFLSFFLQTPFYFDILTLQSLTFICLSFYPNLARNLRMGPKLNFSPKRSRSVVRFSLVSHSPNHHRQ